MNSGETLRGFNYAGGLVALAAKWNWSQIRTVRLNQQPVEWKLSRDLPQIIGLLKCQRPRERNVEAEFNCILRHLQCSAKTMQHTRTIVANQFLAKDLNRICVSLA